jgi:hypothetical protein
MAQSDSTPITKKDLIALKAEIMQEVTDKLSVLIVETNVKAIEKNNGVAVVKKPASKAKNGNVFIKGVIKSNDLHEHPTLWTQYTTMMEGDDALKKDTSELTKTQLSAVSAHLWKTNQVEIRALAKADHAYKNNSNNLDEDTESVASECYNNGDEDDEKE